MNTVKNPYVGPRTFQKEDGAFFFGREREARDLMALIASERLILFYAQSGAGKSSLLNTRLIPELENGEFEVLPVGRVQGDLPAGVEVENVYAYNLMGSLLQQKTSPQALAKLSLSEFLCRLDFNDSGYFFDPQRTTGINAELHWRRVLIIDQFEELFTTHLDAWVHRGGFFRQIAQALNDDPYLTVILIMRDDYIASLDLYAHLLPGGLRTRYYMQRLTKEAALKAVKNPVESIRPFADGVAEKLVEDLSGVVVQRAGGVREIQSGQYVEPVQLQVVCYSLWENLPPRGKEITGADLQEVGDVNQSLELFYNNRVAAVAKEKNIPERLIREWFDRELITGNKTRNMVLQERESSAGLRNDVIQSLQGDLVRAELRAGQIWVELSHDRLVEPVLGSNAKWFEQNLSKFQRRVVLWDQQGRGENLLLGEKELAEAEQEADSLNITRAEQDFLEESKKQIKRLQRDLAQRRRIFVAFITSLVLLVVAIIAGIYSLKVTGDKLQARQKQLAAEQGQLEAQQQAVKEQAKSQKAVEAEAKAEHEKDQALAGAIAAQADSLKASDHSLALLLGLEAYHRESNLLTRTTLFNLLQYSPYTRLFGYRGPVSSLAVSPDGKVIASASCREYNNNQCKYGSILLSDTQTHQQLAELPGEYGIVNNLVFHQYDKMLLLAAGGCVPADGNNKGCTDSKGQISLWDVTKVAEPSQLSFSREHHTGLIKAIAISPQGDLLASGSFDTRIILWDISDPTKPVMKTSPFLGHTSFVNSLAFSPDGKTLASGSDDLKIILWNVSHPGQVIEIGKPIEVHTAAINSVAFDPNGKKFASASDDETIILWNWDPGPLKLQNPVKLEGHDSYVKSVAFNANGTKLASVSLDKKVILWDAITGQPLNLPLTAHTKAVNAVTFGTVKTSEGSDLPYLFTGGDDRVVIQWDLSIPQALSQPIAKIPVQLDEAITAKSTALEASVVNKQQIQLSTQTEPLSGHTGVINSLNFSPPIDGKILLASASDDQTVILWAVTEAKSTQIFLKLESFENPVALAYFEGNQLITIEKNSGRTIRWVIDPADWSDRVCNTVNVLTGAQSAEWDRLVPDHDYHATCEAAQ